MTRRVTLLAALCLVLSLAACLRPPPQAGPFARFAEFAGREVEEVELEGPLAVPEDSLRSVLATRPSRCNVLFLPVCPFGIGRRESRLDLQEMARDVARIRLFYRSFGYYGTRVLPEVVPGEEDGVVVRFAIAPGERVFTRSVEVEGTEGIIPPGELEEEIPLRVGEPFGIDEFEASADTVLTRLRSRGYLYTQILRNFSIDTVTKVAEARFGAIPGPQVRVDTVLILGADRLERKTILKQLAFREGDVLVAGELNRSQRNLYDLGLVSFASVQLAPDSLQVDPDSAYATVVVRVVEAPRYLAEASAGYGTLDCFRTQSRVVDRHFLGGARRLELTGSVSKLGVGQPLDAGFENNFLCSELEGDPFSQELNYLLAATFTQPRLLGTRTTTVFGVHAERASDPFTFLRVSRGAQLSLGRQVARQTLLTTTLDVERVQTEAPDEFFCVVLQVCRRELILPLEEPRWSNSLSLSLVRDRTVFDVVPVGGYQLRSSVDWASPVLLSDDRYLRLLGDGSVYREVRPGWVLAGRLMGGAFLERFFEEERGFIPPERLFYAGGPNTVRGLERNALGPAVYVTEDTLRPGDPGFEGFEELDVRAAATGGTRMVVGSAELRMPSPVLSDRLRFAVFVDAGRVWTGVDTLTNAPFRVTPGAGVRYLSPVGPIRVDVGVKTFARPEEGPLFGFTRERELELLDPRFQPEALGFLERFQLYITVGQPF